MILKKSVVGSKLSDAVKAPLTAPGTAISIGLPQTFINKNLSFVRRTG